MNKKLIPLTAICFASASAFAYEITTHTVITIRAAEQSQFGSSAGASELAKRLGILNTATALGQDYLHMGSPVEIRNMTLAGERNALADVKEALKPELLPVPSTIAGWLMKGAIREDDNSIETPDTDEAGGVFERPFAHFFEPVTNRGLTLGALNKGPRSVDWALDANAAIGSRKNYFRMGLAREAMWRALTLKAYDPLTQQITGNVDDPIGGPFTSKQSIQKAYWATAFRTIGDVIHLLQDAAQPQHTRNDPHSGYGCFSYCLAGHSSFYEFYMEARTLKRDEFTLVERTDPYINAVTNKEPFKTNKPQLTYCCYPPPRFANYEDYFYTGTGSANAAGKGLANYSNRGFYSFGTNIGKTTLPSPPPDGVGLATAYVTTGLTNMAGEPLAGTAVFRTGTVVDTTAGAAANEPNVKLATVGIWDDALQQKSPAYSSHSLNYYNYDDMAKLLIPRAVAYSAGLIDYFFRGQMEITPPDEGVYSLVDHFDFAGANQTATNPGQGFIGFKTIKLKLRNITPDITPSGGGAVAPQNMVSGKIVAVLKFHRNLNYSDDLSGEPISPAAYSGSRTLEEEIVVSDRVKDENGNIVNTITLGADPSALIPAKLLYFEFDKHLPINATDVYLQVVYRGYLGTEADAVVVQTVDISEPTYFAYMNASDYIRLNSKVYTRAEINSNSPPAGGELSGSQLRALVQPTSCIDSMTDQLSANCFPNIPINFALKLGTIANNTTMQLAPTNVRTYVRMAMLTPKDAPAQLDQSNSNCVPKDTVPLPGRILQTNYSLDADGTPRITTVADSLFPPPVRGVYGYTLSCVTLGDGVLPSANSTDNRDIKMTPLTGTNLKPIQITGFKFGAP